MSTPLKLALTFTAIDAASGVMRMLEGRIRGMGAAGKQTQKDFESMVSSMQAGLKGLTVTWMAFEKVKPMISTAANVQEALLEMKMTLATAGKETGKLATELERVERVADVLQKKTPFSSLDIIKAETAFKKAGIDIADITEGKGAAYAAATLATIAGKGQTPESVAGIMTHVAMPFHVRGSEYGRMANLFQKIITSSTLDLPGFGAGMANFGGVAHNLGLDMEHTAQALMTVGESVRNPDAAGTYLKNFLLAISAPTKGEKEAQEEAGLNFWTRSGHLKNWDQIVAELQRAGAGMSDEEAANMRRKAFQMRGMEAVIPLSQKGMGSYKEAGEKLAKTADIETKLAIALEGLNRQATSLSGTMETAISNTFKPMLKSLTRVTESANDTADAFGKFAAGHQKEFGWVEGAGAAGLGVLGLYSMFRIFKGLKYGGRFLGTLGGNWGSTAMGIAEGKAVQAATGVTPVFVTNWPGGVLGGPGAPMPLEKGTILDQFGRPIGRTAGAVAVSAGATGVEIAGMSAAAAGAIGGAIVTALVGGSFLMRQSVEDKYKETGYLPPSPMDRPGMTEYGDYDAELIAEAVKQVKPENKVTINVSVDQNGRVTSSSNDSSTTAKINLKRGRFMQDMRRDEFLQDLNDTHY